MKKILLYLFGAVLLFTSCQKDEENVFDQSPDQRLNETLAKYQTALLSAPNGWKATIIPGTGARYNFFFRFDDKNRVKMFSDWDTATAGTVRESSYRLKALQQPSLIFDTYSYIHLLADPDPRVNIGIEPGLPGLGLKTDFEYAIDSVTADQVMLTGRFNGTKLTLTKATQQEAAAWESGLWERSLSLLNIEKIPVYFKRLVVSGQAFNILLDTYARTITFTWVDNTGVNRFFTSPFSFGPNGVVFNRVTAGNVSFNSFSNLNWNNATSELSLSVNNTATTISGAAAPAAVDKTAPEKWRQAAVTMDTYYASYGFTIDGVFDSLGITSVSLFALTWPQVPIGGNTVDFFGFFDGAELFGYTLKVPTFTADGRVVFTQQGTFGTIPAGASTVAANTLAQMTDPAGYYLIQVNATTYDMVSAKDGRAWIRWFLAQ